MGSRFLTKLLGVCVVAGFMSSAWAIPLSTIGSVDQLLASEKLSNSGEDTETNWVSSVLGFDVTFDDKLTGSGFWSPVDGNSGLYAIDFGSDDPAYFLVKTGNGSTTNDTHFLFKNLDSLRYGVIDLGDLGFSDLMVGKISHATLFDGNASSVPEPGALALLGAGLIGILIATRRRTVRATLQGSPA